MLRRPEGKILTRPSVLSAAVLYRPIVATTPVRPKGNWTPRPSPEKCPRRRRRLATDLTRFARSVGI